MVGHAVFLPITCSLEFDLISGGSDQGSNSTLVVLGRVPPGMPVSVTVDGAPLGPDRLAPGPDPSTLLLLALPPAVDTFMRYSVSWPRNGTAACSAS
jgi:hypothetical protein